MSVKSAKRFLRDDSGTLVIFAVFMVLMIITMGGIGVDLMRSERDRTVLQHTLDRAILAAADLDQQQAPDVVVKDYFETAGLQDFLTDVTVDQGLNFKTVGAKAEAITKTAFMKMAGVETLSAAASGVAEERISKVEISMVLDISGSMGWNDKMPTLRAAATNFVDSIVGDTKDGSVSISIVPYTEQVNVGPEIFAELKKNHDHDYSYCVEFEHGDFYKTHLNETQTYHQGQHFQWNYDGRHNDLSNPTCPSRTYEEVTPISGDGAALKAQIAQLQPRAGTQIFLGMKWGVALLDPQFAPITTALVNNGAMSSTYSDRPAAFDDAETLKTVILMTDGQNSASNRIKTPQYNSKSDYYHWSKYNLWYYLTKYVRSNKWGRYYVQKYSADEGDMYTDAICSVAKEAGIVIWTIGFEVEDHGADVMRSCASSPAHFFRVSGTEINDAFDAIARQLNQLRLTQ